MEHQWGTARSIRIVVAEETPNVSIELNEAVQHKHLGSTGGRGDTLSVIRCLGLLNALHSPCKSYSYILTLSLLARAVIFFAASRLHGEDNIERAYNNSAKLRSPPAKKFLR